MEVSNKIRRRFRASERSEEITSSLLTTCVFFYTEVNRRGFVKILKKYDLNIISRLSLIPLTSFAEWIRRLVSVPNDATLIPR